MRGDLSARGCMSSEDGEKIGFGFVRLGRFSGPPR